VADESDPMVVDLRSRSQIGHAGANVVREVLARRAARPSLRAIHAAIVQAQHGDAAPSKRVGELSEWPIIGEETGVLVALLRPRAGNRHHRGNPRAWTIARQRQ